MKLAWPQIAATDSLFKIKNNSEYSAKQKGAEILLLSGFALN